MCVSGLLIEEEDQYKYVFYLAGKHEHLLQFCSVYINFVHCKHLGV